MNERIRTGNAASPGIVIGPSFLFLSNRMVIPDWTIAEDQILKEISNLDQAIYLARMEIQDIKQKIRDKLGDNEANIFGAHLYILEDPVLEKKTKDLIQEKLWNAAFALNHVLDHFLREIQSIGDQYIQDRAADIQDVGLRVISKLLDDKYRDPLTALSHPMIIVASSLSPSQTAQLDKQKILGIVTETGGSTSHVAILARALQVPAIVGVKGILQHVQHGTILALDGVNGELIIQPSAEERSLFLSRQKELQNLQNELILLQQLPTQTKRGYHVSVKVNLEIEDEINILSKYFHEGIGLCRTEFLYLDRDEIPSEEDQFQTYKRILNSQEGRPVTFRTLDIGGDKLRRINDSEELLDEPNPSLGVRGVRFSFRYLELFKEQIRAILRSSIYGEIKILFPMVAGYADFLKIKAVVDEAKADLRKMQIDFREDVPLGVMIEVPSAALTIDILAKYVDFISLGTNDLIQYIMAADRINQGVQDYYNPQHPAFLRLVSNVIQTAKEKDCPVSVCGEMAAEDRYIPLLLAMGVTELSVTPYYVPRIKKVIRTFDDDEWKNILAELLSLETIRDVEKRLTEHHERLRRKT